MNSSREETLDQMIKSLRGLAARYKVSTKPSFLAGQLTMQARSPAEFAELLVNAESDPLQFRAARLEIAATLELTGKIPEAMQAFAVRVLQGEAEPRHHGRYAEIDDYRARVVVHTVEFGVLAGFSALRSEASNHKNSACDIAAEAFSAVGLSPATYSGIKGIYLGSRGRANLD